MMTFKEFLNQKDHSLRKLTKPASLSGFQVAQSFIKDAVKSDLPDPAKNPETPSVSAPMPTPTMGSSRNFTARLKTTPRKPSQFLPRGNDIKLNAIGKKL